MDSAPPSLHIYQREIDTAERTSLSVLSARIPSGARVLDLGCGSGAVGRHLAARGGAGPIDGLTISPQEAELAAPHYRRVEVANLESADLTALFASLAVIAGLLAVAALLLIPAFLRGARRRGRRAAVLTGSPPQHPSPGGAAWQEVSESAVDYGIRLPAGLTPEAVVDAIGLAIAVPEDQAATGTGTGTGTGIGTDTGSAVRAGAAEQASEARAALGRIRVEHEHAAFSDPGSEQSLRQEQRVELWNDVLVVRSALRSSATPAARRRAVLAPASLSGRR